MVVVVVVVEVVVVVVVVVGVCSSGRTRRESADGRHRSGMDGIGGGGNCGAY